MADTGVKISGLPAASTADSADVLPGVQSGTTKKFPLSVLLSFLKGNLSKSDVGLGNVANVLQYSAQNPPTPQDVGAQPAVKPGTVTLSATWSGSGPYTQTVTVTGATITANSQVSLQPTPAQLAQMISDGVTALVIENNAGVLTATALGAAISVAMTVACTVTEVSA